VNESNLHGFLVEKEEKEDRKSRRVSMLPILNSEHDNNTICCPGDIDNSDDEESCDSTNSDEGDVNNKKNTSSSPPSPPAYDDKFNPVSCASPIIPTLDLEGTVCFKSKNNRVITKRRKNLSLIVSSVSGSSESGTYKNRKSNSISRKFSNSDHVCGSADITHTPLSRRSTFPTKNEKIRSTLHYFREATKSVPFEYKTNLANFCIKRPYGIATPKKLQPDIFNSSIISSVSVAVTILANNSVLFLFGVFGVRYKINHNSNSSSDHNNNCCDDDWKVVPNIDVLETPLGYVTYIDEHGQNIEYSLDEIIEQAMLIREQYCTTILNTAFDMEQLAHQKLAASTEVTDTASSSFSQSPPSLIKSILSNCVEEDMIDPADHSVLVGRKFEFLQCDDDDGDNLSPTSLFYSDQTHDTSSSSVSLSPSTTIEINPLRQDYYEQWKLLSIKQKQQFYRFCRSLFVAFGFCVGSYFLIINLVTHYHRSAIRNISLSSNLSAVPSSADESMNVMKNSSRIQIDFDFFSITDPVVEDENHNFQKVTIETIDIADYNKIKHPTEIHQHMVLQEQQLQGNNDDLLRKVEQVDVALVGALRYQVDSLAVRLELEQSQRHKLEDIIHELENELGSIRREHKYRTSCVIAPTNEIDNEQRIEEVSHQGKKAYFAVFNKTREKDQRIIGENIQRKRMFVSRIGTFALQEVKFIGKATLHISEKIVNKVKVLNNLPIAAVSMQSIQFVILKGDWKERFLNKVGSIVQLMTQLVDISKLVTERLGMELQNSNNKFLKHGLEGSDTLWCQVKKNVDDVSLAGIGKLDRVNESIYTITDFALSKLESIRKHVLGFCRRKSRHERG